MAEKKDNLTPRQDSFAFYLAEGLSQREAYKRAYINCKLSDRNIDSKACALFKMGKVRARYEEYLQEKRRARLRDAIVKGEKAEKELEKIAYGTATYPVYNNKTGKKEEREPTISQRIEALKELRKDNSEILKAQAAADSGANEIVVEFKLKVVEHEN